jgi:serine/threonine protein kinase
VKLLFPFLSQVLLLGRLHHKNLVNLVGYGAERGQHMLLYVYMSKGSLASHLYGKKRANFLQGNFIMEKLKHLFLRKKNRTLS